MISSKTFSSAEKLSWESHINKASLSKFQRLHIVIAFWVEINKMISGNGNFVKIINSLNKYQII